MMNRLREYYFAAWAICLPIASFLVIPSVQGTTPGNLFALLSVVWIPFYRRDKARLYLKVLATLGAGWIGLFLLSQVGLHFFDNPTLPQFLAVDFFDDHLLLRRSIFTQSAYLAACFLTGLYFLFAYRSEWRRYIFWGAWVLALYGIYEWVFYLIMKHPGDFLANRSFLGGEHPGSWSQVFRLGGVELLRIKSTTGEPSFLALAGMPYLILAIDHRKWLLVGALSFCLIFSLSTSAYLSLILLALFSLIYFKAWRGRYVVWVVGFFVVAGIIAALLPNFIEVVFAQKLSGKGPSGNLRQHVYLAAWDYWTHLSLWNEMVGIGFGSAFVTPWLGGLLVNTGLAGVLLYFAAFLWPMVRLPNTPENWGLKGMLLVTFFMLSASVADFTYLTTWMTVGLAYRRLSQLNSAADSPKRRSSSGGIRVAGGRIPTIAAPVNTRIDEPL